MSFSFGSSNPSAFGSAAKPTFSFGGGNTAATTTSFSFGGSTSSTGFGTSFGAPASNTAAPFGTTPAATAPSLFGGAGFGTNTAAAPATSTSSLFGGIGFGANTANKPATGFGAGAFGANTFGTGQAPSFGTGQAPSFGTGQAPSFGTGTAPSFGTTATPFGANTLGSNNFGTGSSFGAGSNFGSSFGAKPAASGFGGFGSTLGATAPFGQAQQQQQQPAGPSSAHEALVAAVFNCRVFGDERDQILAKWNLLQAQWGTGQAYYSCNAQPLQLNEQNPLCRFKAVGYSKVSGKEDKDGHVAMVFSKTEQEIKTNQQALMSSLQGLLGNKPNLTVTIDSTKAVPDNKTQIVIYVIDKNSNNSHVAASELAAFLNNGNARTSLSSAGCSAVTPHTKPSPQTLQQYLHTPPTGMDIRLWKQAQSDNPDPDNYIPVPIIGFSEIKYRSSCQAEQAALQSRWLAGAAKALSELRARRDASAATLAQLQARAHSHAHSLLQIIGRREIIGRVGVPLSPEEEAARAGLHEMTSQLAAPPLYNGRLNELLCAVRLQRSASSGAPHERYQLDPGAQEDLKQFLALQQRGMAHLLDTAKKDLAALNIISEGMSRMVKT